MKRFSMLLIAASLPLAQLAFLGLQTYTFFLEYTNKNKKMTFSVSKRVTLPKNL